jgi:hypothetical protein
MNALDFIADVFFWLIVFWVFLKAIELYLKAKNEALKEQIKDMTSQIKDNFIYVNIEKHGEMFYLFEKETNRFIAQGSNFDEIKEHCLTRFKDKSVITDEYQMDQLGFK